ncbi:MAG TPA: HPr kinase/phosphatase C-terminal domain-containing protein [Xanthobacteraceae bacterium]|jgi:HPr kinase/phosphorylase|nr:HPr kinase/phosphatase C-terminal domain-containing protein [Xanthobacteraceae bacterium]
MTAAPTIHASAVLVGARAVLIRGPSGAGKSRLAFELIEAGRTGRFAFTRLVGDDRLELSAVNGRLLVRPAPALAGLIEVRGAGIFRLDYEPGAVVGLVVDLAAEDAQRLPEQAQITLESVKLPRLAVPSGLSALSGIVALLTLEMTAGA